MKRCIFGLLFSLCFLCSVFTLGNRENQITLNSGNNQVKQRIVSLVPSVTETLFALNAEKNIVARTDYCNWPEETSSIPSVGGFDGKSLSLEKIISFQPDLVCVATVMHDHLVGPLQQYGIEVFVSSADSISSVKEEIIQLAKLTNKEQEGKDLIKKIDLQIQEASKIATKKTVPTVYWEISSAPYYTCGQDSFITEAIEKAGGKNIFDSIPFAYSQVSEESIIAYEPEIILFPDYTNTGDTSFFFQRTNWQQIPALKENKIFPVDANLFSRPGPRIGQMILELAQLMHQNSAE